MEPIPLPYDLDFDPDIERCARKLATLFVALKRNLPGASSPYEFKSHYTSYRSFLHAASMILDYEASCFRRVNLVDYVLAHLWFWGAGCFSTRLSSSSSIVLYNAFTQLHAATRIMPDYELDNSYAQEMVAYLARVRGESEETVRENLQFSGLI